MTTLGSAPVLSTPETHIFEDSTPIITPEPSSRLSSIEIYDVYEVSRTTREILEGGWQRIALQFPDSMLTDGVRVFEALEKELKESSPITNKSANKEGNHEEALEKSFNNLTTTEAKESHQKRKLCILADTSYGACCVDEVAAEHVDAEVVVHYGRSCLSPTARLPVIYVFTTRPLDIDLVIHAFDQTYRERGKQEKILVIADITYNSHIPIILEQLTRDGWENVLAPDVIHDPSALVPNRKINIQEEELKTYSLFHISDPPPALLLTLNSRVKDLHIHPTSSTSALQTNTSITLRRRYALLTSLSTNPIFGILINTLSVRNYLETVTTIKKMIEKAGKKSYTFVVGKVNAAKIANFSEIGGWVVVGCWESSLIESTEFYRPIITPFELQLALMGDEERVWTGEWRADFGSIDATAIEKTTPGKKGLEEVNGEDNLEIEQDDDSEEESAPPEFDLRTGRYVSHSRPMRTSISASNPTPKPLGEPKNETVSQALTRKVKGDLATVNGAVSPGAEYLRTQRTWTGLGSDFSTEDASTSIEEGRGGIARGYRVGDEERT